MQILDLADEVALKLENPQVTAKVSEQLNLLDRLLVQPDLGKRVQRSVIVLGPLRDRDPFVVISKEDVAIWASASFTCLPK